MERAFNFKRVWSLNGRGALISPSGVVVSGNVLGGNYSALRESVRLGITSAEESYSAAPKPRLRKVSRWGRALEIRFMRFMVNVSSLAAPILSSKIAIRYCGNTFLLRLGANSQEMVLREME